MAQRTAPDPTLAIAYLRVSTDDQQLGPEAQRAAIEAWAARQGARVVAWHVDHGVSGATPLDERPGLVAALADLGAQGAGVLVAAKRDRIARDVVVAGLVDRAARSVGAVLRTADGASDAAGPEGALMSGVIDVFAQYERALICARTRAALAVKRARGERIGTLPYGYRLAEDGRTLVADREEQDVLLEVRELRRSGLTYRAVVDELARKGLVNRKGRPFSVASVHAMVGAA